jgi:amino acid permease
MKARTYSHEFIVPAANAPSRQATRASAVLALVSTICGGGVLTLPFAFARAGLLLGTVFVAGIARLSVSSAVRVFW